MKILPLAAALLAFAAAAFAQTGGAQTPPPTVMDYNVKGDLGAPRPAAEKPAASLFDLLDQAAVSLTTPSATALVSDTLPQPGQDASGIRTDSSPLAASGSLSEAADVSGDLIEPEVSPTKIDATQTEREQQLINRYQSDLKNGAAPNAAMTKYGTLLDERTPAANPNLPPELRVKLGAKSLREARQQQNSIGQSEKPAAVRTLDSDAAQDKATDAFRDDQPHVLEKVIDSRKQQIKDALDQR